MLMTLLACRIMLKDRRGNVTNAMEVIPIAAYYVVNTYISRILNVVEIFPKKIYCKMQTKTRPSNNFYKLLNIVH